MNARLARTVVPKLAGQPTTLAETEQAAASYGVAPGAKAMMQAESRGAQRAVASGVYIVWRSKKSGADCARVASDSRCFCGHPLSAHKAVSKSNPQPPACTSCACKRFDFVPSRPEECGMWWLPRRKGFDVHSWRAPCRCKHGHDAHDPSTRRCRVCACSCFVSDYRCLGCDGGQVGVRPPLAPSPPLSPRSPSNPLPLTSSARRRSMRQSSSSRRSERRRGGRCVPTERLLFATPPTPGPTPALPRIHQVGAAFAPLHGCSDGLRGEAGLGGHGNAAGALGAAGAALSLDSLEEQVARCADPQKILTRNLVLASVVPSTRFLHPHLHPPLPPTLALTFTFALTLSPTFAPGCVWPHHCGAVPRVDPLRSRQQRWSGPVAAVAAARAPCRTAYVAPV